MDGVVAVLLALLLVLGLRVGGKVRDPRTVQAPREVAHARLRVGQLAGLAAARRHDVHLEGVRFLAV